MPGLSYPKTANIDDSGNITNESDCSVSMHPGDTVVYTLNSTGEKSWIFDGNPTLTWSNSSHGNGLPGADFLSITPAGAVLTMVELAALPSGDGSAEIQVCFNLKDGNGNKASPDPLIINVPTQPTK